MKNVGIPQHYLRNVNVRWHSFDLTDLLEMRFKEEEQERFQINKGDIVVCEGGEPGRGAIWKEDTPIMYQKALHRVRCLGGAFNEYVLYVIEHYANCEILKMYFTGSTIKHLTGESLSSIYIPLPPLHEQKRIVESIEHWLSLVDNIEENKENLQVTIKQTKSKILDLAIHGKLVPQDPTDEPASELLKRINPKAEIACDNAHYRNLPKGWAVAPMQMLCSLVDGEKQRGIERINLDVKFLRGEREAKTLSTGKYVAANTLLILVDGENSGEVFRTPIEGYQGSTFKQLAINDNMNTDYVLQVINLHRKTLRENKVGSAIPHLNKKLFKAIEVPIPPYEEQQRIVNAINKAFTTLDVIAENL